MKELLVTPATTAHDRELTWYDGEFRRGGRPHRVLCGALHYFRVHPDLWAQRLAQLAAMGLNTVDTYVAWNFHEMRRGRPDFTGWRDLERFIELAGEAGLDVIVRPGPYICAEWDGGGLPAWLQFDGPMALRCSDPLYQASVARWFDQLIPRIARHQSSTGGPVVAVQVENEYGSYGDDAEHLQWLRSALIERGLDCLLFTSDGPTHLMLQAGSIPGLLSVQNFGSRAGEAAAIAAEHQAGQPFMCGEFWNGWFDHWGEPHQTRTSDSAAGTLKEILDLGGSVNLYMAHGGTNFGLWSGANEVNGRLQPTVTSYDYDAAIAEDGTVTPKFHAFRELLSAVREDSPPAPQDGAAARLAPATITPTRRTALLPLLDSLAEPGLNRVLPADCAELRQSAGLTLYSARPAIPRGGATLEVDGLADRAVVFVDGQLVGVLDGTDRSGVRLDGDGRVVDLLLVVENLGRINYGPLLGSGKGILGKVMLDRRIVHHWQSRPWDPQLDSWAPTGDGCPTAAPGEPGLAEFEFEIDSPADGFLALDGWVKGYVWLNDFLLGRYWEIGPQRTLYAPAPLWRPGRNVITVLEFQAMGQELQLTDRPDLGPCTEFNRY